MWFRMAGDIAALRNGQRRMREFLETSGAGERATYRAELVLDELVTNVIRHGYGADASRSAIDIGISVEAAEIVFTIVDDGPEFNPLLAAEPQRAANLAEAPIGGLGISLVRMAAAKIDYERRDDRNRVRVRIPRE
jgi:sigma-B regulation protein RsbU (phosphoserine phosphatase)